MRNTTLIENMETGELEIFSEWEQYQLFHKIVKDKSIRDAIVEAVREAEQIGYLKGVQIAKNRLADL